MVAGVRDCGSYDGRACTFLFPEDQWQLNLLPAFREDVVRHLANLSIQRHQFAHHVMSSQAFALNLAAPFLRHSDRLRPVFGDEVQVVEEVQVEVAGHSNYFHEPGTRGANRTSADLGVWVRLADGHRALHLFEVKFTETGFGECSKGRSHGGTCDADGPAIVDNPGALCPLSGAPHRRNYWRLMRERGVFAPGALGAAGACPFRYGGYQLMRNQLLAAMMEADPECDLDLATFSLLLHDDNHDVTQLRMPAGSNKPVGRAWPRLLADPSRFGGVWSARAWVQTFLDHPDIGEWARQMMERYFPDGLASARAGTTTNRSTPSTLRAGHWRTVQWIASNEFVAVKNAYDRVVGPGCVYFRPTASGVVVIALADDARGYVGFRTSHQDRGYLLSPGSAPPEVADLHARYRAFRSWLPTVSRESAEESAVIPWLRQALQGKLVLPGMGGEWLFLNQEWRFLRDDGGGRKSDVLAVHAPSGRLGIIEAKDSASKRAVAAAQVAEYGRYWLRDVGELAPFFTEVLRAMGRLYGNVWAATASVSRESAELFFAFPEALGMKVETMG